ncbi:MAG: hypothetical protein ACRDRV_04115 [Pseudonocardiaceae bacterium]
MTGSATARVVLHVGTPKTGTTYLQDLMWRNRRELGRRGVCYPGKYRESHFLAAMDLQGATVEEVGDPHLPWAWDRLVAEVAEAQGTVVVSHELFSPMEPDRVEQALDAFGGAELHVVCTVRDLGRQLPAVWQEDLKNRHTLSFAEFLDAVRNSSNGYGGNGHWLGELFWRMQDVPALLRRWADTLPPQQVHVVTVPPAGSAPEQLWRRFATVLGVDPDGLAMDGPVERNHSLGPAEAQLLRRLNLALPRDLPWWVYERTVRRELVDALGRRRGGTQRLAVPPDHQCWVIEQAKKMAADLADAGYRVVGNLDDLVPAAPTPAGVPAGPDPDEVTDSVLLDVALDAAREMVLRCGESIAQAQRPSLRQRIRNLGERHVAVRRLLAGYRSLRRSY